MHTVIITIIAFSLALLGLSLGAILGRGEPQGSCGGPDCACRTGGGDET